MIPAGRTLDDARAFAMALSVKLPGHYVTLVAVFGLFATTYPARLHVHAPGDSVGGSYWLNGHERRFTDAQRGAHERATPTLS